VDDLEVLDGLRHHPLVGRHHQQDRVEAVDAGQHVADEAGMAGHVDDPDQPAAGQGQVGEAEVDRHPAALLLGQPVGIDPGQGVDERRLAVVDVAGCADNGIRKRHRPGG